MNLSINLGNWNSIFAVPTSVVDEHIKLAGAVQLKVLLLILRHSGTPFSAEDIGKILSIQPADVRDTLHYWEDAGLIVINDECIIPAQASFCVSGQSDDCAVLTDKAPTPKKIDEPRPRPISRSQRPDPLYVAQRINDSEELNYLMQEAQVILSRPISNADSASLLMFHETDGLPVDVILMLMQYCVGIGKSNMKYIEKIAISWGFEEIDTLEKAENKIRLLEKSRQAWNTLEKTIGIEKRSPTEKENEAVNRWLNEWQFSEQMVKEAYDRCVDAKGKYILGYMDSIIKRWYNSGIKTIEQAIEEKRSMKRHTANDSQSTSYNIDKYYETMDIFA